MSEIEHVPERTIRSADDLVTLVSLVNSLLRQWRTILVAGVLVAGLATVGSFARSGYVARATFAPAELSSPLQGVSGIAQAFGVNLGSAGGGPSLDFYAALLRSRDLLTAAVRTRYHFLIGSSPADSTSATLFEFCGFDAGDTTTVSLTRAIRKLSRNLDIQEDQNANTITLQVKAPSPSLAEAIATRILALVNQFNVQQLQSQASAERTFLEARLDSARVRLQSAQDSMSGFLEENRSISNSPRLLFEQQRLQQSIDLHHQVYVALAQSDEQARLAEVRDTPVITIVDGPVGSALRERHALRNGLIGGVIGLAIGTLAAIASEHLRRERESYPDDFAELARLRGSVFRLGRRIGGQR